MGNSRNRGDSSNTGVTTRDSYSDYSPRGNSGNSRHYSVIGEGGKVRHEGYFSSENPYFDDLMIANNNQDKDALYERAVEWEADSYNLHEQRAYNEAMRDEQRAYDSPLADLMRKRAAGYNPDIADGGAGGSSAGSSSAGVPPTQIADQQGQTKFNNAYDNIGLVQNGFQTAASVLGSLSSFGSSIVGAISTFKKLPSEINLADAQASAANATADATRQLTPVQVAAGHLNNLTSSLSLFEKAGNIVAPGTTLDDAKSIFSSVGIPEDQHEGLYNSIKAYHDNPAMRNFFAENERKAIENEEYNKVYTADVVSGMIEVGKEIQDATLAFDKDIAILKSSVTKLLDMNQLSSDMASAIQTEAQVTAEQQKLQYDKVKRDVKAFVSNLKDLKFAEEHSQKLIDDINKRAKERAGKNLKGEDNPVKLTAAEKALIQIEEERIKHYKALGSMSLSEVYSMIGQTSQNAYYREENLDAFGNLEPTVGIQKHQLFMRYAWSDYSSGRVSEDQLVKSLIGRVPVVGTLLNDAFEPL